MSRLIISAVIIFTAIFAGGVIAGVMDLIHQKKSCHVPFRIYEKYFKRSMDFIFSSVALIVLSPAMLLIALLVRIKIGKPVIFRQSRLGKEEKIFTLLKFRSMTNEIGLDGKLLPDKERLVSYGKFLRTTSIDELPSLLNVLIGDLSLIGPRPLLIEYLPWYTKEEHHRHDVRPGLTGWAQVNGRNTVDWDKRFQLDLEYIRNLSFKMDIKIFILTIAEVFNKRDIAEDTRATEGNFAEIRKEIWEKNDG